MLNMVQYKTNYCLQTLPSNQLISFIMDVIVLSFAEYVLNYSIFSLLLVIIISQYSITILRSLHYLSDSTDNSFQDGPTAYVVKATPALRLETQGIFTDQWFLKKKKK